MDLQIGGSIQFNVSGNPCLKCVSACLYGRENSISNILHETDSALAFFFVDYKTAHAKNAWVFYVALKNNKQEWD